MLTIDEAATHLRVHPSVIRKLRENSDLPATRIGDQMIVRRSDLDAYVAALVPMPNDLGTDPWIS